MALSNHERVGKGLEAVRRGLSPYVLREMKRHYRERLEEMLGRDLDGSQLACIRQEGGGDDAFLEVVDADSLLKLMRGYYQQVFFDKLGHDARSYVGEITTARNNWAHQQSFSTDDAARALDTMARLLKAVSAAEEASEVLQHQRAVQRQIFESEARRETRKSSEIPESTGGLKPWREVADPHRDVASGRYQEAEFAADLAEVWRGNAGVEYQDPREFFRRTYLTEGMVSLLAGAMQRVAGDGGDPVIRLQTVFGGGKTHSMLALYHALGGEIGLSDVPDGEKLAAAAEMDFLPGARRAVLVGTDLDPNRPRDYGDVTAHTLWGEMACQIGGSEGYSLVAEADGRGVAPGADTIKRLLDEHGPALVLLDELVAYIRNIYGREEVPAGSFDSNITFLQNLTEAARRSDGSIVVVSIPVSERAGEEGRSDVEIGGEAGRLAAERLESVIGRLESIWKPVGAAESFEIVRRRLFSGEMNAAARDAVVESFAQMYRDNRSEYPSECSAGEYERRLRASYPIHPELFDRLYQDWSTLERFQRTRGVLRLMASVIHELWSRGDGSLMIMPGSVPLDSPKVSNQFLRYLPEGWNAVMDTDVDGPGSRPEALDEELRNLGRLAAARRVARTVFVGSAPSVAGQQVRGLQEVRVRLGCVQPGESASVFMDALRRLNDQLAYLYTDGGRYWYDTRPNVNREAADRAQQQRPEDVEAEITGRLKPGRDRGEFAGVHVAPASSADVPDEPAVRLVVLPPEETYRKNDPDNAAQARAADILDNRGSSPRRYRNAPVFLAPDRERAQALEEAARWYLAWGSILEDEEQLNLDSHGKKQAQNNLRRAEETLEGRLRESYRWLLYPQQEGTGPLEWMAVGLNSRGDGIVARVSRRLVSEEAIIPRWSPALLKRELDKYFWDGGEYVGLKRVREALFTYPYFPRLRDEGVLIDAVKEGVKSRDYFGYADTVENGRYQGLQFGGLSAAIYVDSESVLVHPEAASRQQEEDRSGEEKREKERVYLPDGGTGKEEEWREGPDEGKDAVTPPPPTPTPRHFRGTVRLDPALLSSKTGQVSEEVIEHLVSILGSDVRVRLEIDAELPEGTGEHVRRVVEENCRTLGFEDFGFEEE